MRKLRIAILGLFLIASLQGCTMFEGRAFLKVEDLAMPVVKAVSNDNYDALARLLPPEEHMAAVWQTAGGKLGRMFYNKYTDSYRRMTLLAAIRVDNDITQQVANKDGLDWTSVQVGDIDKEEITIDGGKYTMVTVWLKFPPNNTYHLKYSAGFAENQWYLLDDIWLGKPAAAQK